MPRNAWPDWAESMAFVAMVMLPSVPFLKPTGDDKPLASSRCVCDSVVRAPMALQTPGPTGTGEDGIQSFGADGQAHVVDFDHELAGKPQAFFDFERVVQVWVVDEALPAHGGAWLFEVTRITMKILSSTFLANSSNLDAYSRACSGSWMNGAHNRKDAGVPCRTGCRR